MSDKIHVAVIGAGIFGCMTALSLANAGFNVVLFERQHNIMGGSSKNNQNRLHLGFHYPRDLNTARQCIDGFDRMIKEFPECIQQDFPNAYYISAINSLTTPTDYIKFCDAAGLSYELLDLNLNKPTSTQNISLGMLCSEATYDCEMLAKSLQDKIVSNASITLKCNTDIVSSSFDKYKFSLSSQDNKEYTFDAVLNCTYGDINRLTNMLGHPIEQYQYEYTIIPVVKSSLSKMGLTLMDGKFLTFMPHGNTGNSLLYHVQHSVIDTVFATVMPDSWKDPVNNPFTKADKFKIFDDMKLAASSYFPELADLQLIDFLHGPRMVLANREDTDARPSLVKNYGNGYITVFSGKVDHCIVVADEIRDLLMVKFKQNP